MGASIQTIHGRELDKIWNRFRDTLDKTRSIALGELEYISLRRSILIGMVAVMAIPLLATPVLAFTGTPGQPNQSCQSVFPTGPLTPSGFNTQGFANAGSVYAGTGQNTQTPANSHAVSQYDVACYEVASH